MLENMQGRKSPKENRDPHADYLASFYRIYKEPTGRSRKPVDSYGFPVLAFKSATVEATRFYDKATSKVALRQMVFLKGVRTKADSQELVEIVGEPEMREDAVRVGMGTDLRYRAMFPEWSAVLLVTFVKSCIDRNSVLSLIDAGGFGVGVGEWRPEKNGQFGTYTIDQSKKVTVV